jgi:hypothetical protein
MKTRARSAASLIALVGSLLACNNDPTRPATSDMLVTVPFTFSAGGAEILTEVRFSLIIGNSGCSVEEAYALFDQLSIRDGEEGRTLGAQADNDPDFTNFAALLTDGVDTLMSTCVYGSGSGDYESRVLVGRPSTGPDLAGYTIDSIEFRIDSVLIASPGSNPNGTGIWTDYDLGGRVVILGHHN